MLPCEFWLQSLLLTAKDRQNRYDIKAYPDFSTFGYKFVSGNGKYNIFCGYYEYTSRSVDVQ